MGTTIKQIGIVPTSTQFEDNGNSALLSSKSHLISTIEQLVAHCKIDLTKWTIDKCVVNSWQVGSKIDGEILVQPLFQVKAWLIRNTNVINTKTIVDEFIKDAHKNSPVHKKVERKKSTRDKFSIVVSLPDIHISKLCSVSETGGSTYNTKVAGELFIDAIKSLMNRSSGFYYDEIIFPIGNDFMHTDNAKGETTAGTRVESDGTWKNSVTYARQIAVKAIDYLSLFAPVKVVIVPGNHDEESSFNLGETLCAWYRTSKDVRIDNGQSPRKYHEYGDCLIMWTHGNNEKADSLPLIAATENPQAWGRTIYREIHTGHLHTKRSTKYKDIDEKNGVRVRIIPSLSPTDNWHNKKGFWNIRSAEAFVYHKKDGCVANFSYNLGIK